MTNQSVSDIPRGKNAHYKSPGCFRVVFFFLLLLKRILILPLTFYLPQFQKAKWTHSQTSQTAPCRIYFLFSLLGFLDLMFMFILINTKETDLYL